MVPDGGGSEELAHKLAVVLVKGLDEVVGKKVHKELKKELYPRGIVDLLKARKAREGEWKLEKSKFASARSEVPPDSLVVAAERLEVVTQEVTRAMAEFNKQKRNVLIQMCKKKTRRARQIFWSHVSRTTRSSSEILALQDSRTGVLYTEKEDLKEEVFKYLSDIFNGGGEPPGGVVQGGGVERQPLQDHGYAAVLPGGAVLPDHGYAADPKPHLQSRDASGKADSDPSGFLDKGFSEAEVKGILRGLGSSKAAGWDTIPNEALKEAPDKFVHLLVVLFNRVMVSGVVPSAWKRGRLVLIHKRGPTTDIYNYRPLTVLVSMSAVFGKLVNSRVTEVVETHRLLGEIQNGFRKSRSGADCAFIINTILWKCSAKGKPVHMAFLDLQKAYDSVDREKLWEILAGMGFGGKFLAAMKSMYEADYVVCSVAGEQTRPVYLGRGLRQGCSLSPVFFALYVAGMGQDLTLARQGVQLYNVCISALFFAVRGFGGGCSV
jgi:hypothetical protein